jgi:hypothetical protein
MNMKRNLKFIAATLLFCSFHAVNLVGQSFFYSGIPDIREFHNAQVFKHPNGVVLHIGYDSSGVIKNTFMLILENGTVAWKKNLISTQPIKPTTFHFFDDNSFAVSGEEILNDTVKNVFVCKINALNNFTWGKKIITPREINEAGPILEDSSRIFASLNMKRKFGNTYFEDALIYVFNLSGVQNYITGLVSNSFAREFKLTHATIARNGDFLGLISYRVNSGNPGAGFVLVRMSNEGELKFSYSINLNQSYKFGGTRGICETESGKIIVACQLDSADSSSTVKPGYLAMFADSGTILKQRIIGFNADVQIDILQASETGTGIPSLFCTVEEDGNRFWALAKIDTADLSLYGARHLPASTDIIPLNSSAHVATGDGEGGVYTAAGLQCASDAKSYSSIMHWSSESTIDCQTLDASAYFEDSLVNYQINVYALSPVTGILAQNFTATIEDTSVPFVQNLCNGCGNLAGLPLADDNPYFFATAQPNEIILQNSSKQILTWKIFYIDGRLLAEGIIANETLRIPTPDNGLYIVTQGDMKAVKVFVP